MQPFSLRTARLSLDQPTPGDVDDIARYCSDPVFERFMTVPWPYTTADAVAFVSQYVPAGWAEDSEWTWAIRAVGGDSLLGVIGVRLHPGTVGFWLAAEHRGRGILPEALRSVVDAVFARTSRDEVRWECVIGNAASLRVAQKCGFRFTGVRPGEVRGRNGEQTTSWTGVLRRDDDRTPKAGWPELPRISGGRGVPPARRVIRLSPDHGRTFPLWENSTPTWDVGYTTDPDEYGLSPALAGDLSRWQEFWEKHADPFDGWDVEENRLAWLRDGYRLEARLAAEVVTFADVERGFGE